MRLLISAAAIMAMRGDKKIHNLCTSPKVCESTFIAKYIPKQLKVKRLLFS
jgi:hypothetical protein